jgi:hypothetical protein
MARSPNPCTATVADRRRCSLLLLQLLTSDVRGMGPGPGAAESPNIPQPGVHDGSSLLQHVGQEGRGESCNIPRGPTRGQQSFVRVRRAHVLQGVQGPPKHGADESVLGGLGPGHGARRGEVPHVPTSAAGWRGARGARGARGGPTGAQGCLVPRAPASVAKEERSDRRPGPELWQHRRGSQVDNITSCWCGSWGRGGRPFIFRQSVTRDCIVLYHGASRKKL